ncbi:unnamed protein product [Schistocephalus solidus]|uniref:Uncharacterized protein n=1 Tax=Schistocephalus solidus TaxID=70667 RepID=A0A183SBD0_SCHSO|nr:unnamed protein product [Schistocephalus solidus]
MVAVRCQSYPASLFSQRRHSNSLTALLLRLFSPAKELASAPDPTAKQASSSCLKGFWHWMLIRRPARLPVCTVAFNAKEHILAHLDQTSAKRLGDFVEEFKDIFDWDGKSAGRTNVTEHCIDTGDARPIRVPPRRLPTG